MLTVLLRVPRIGLFDFIPIRAKEVWNRLLITVQASLGDPDSFARKGISWSPSEASGPMALGTEEAAELRMVQLSPGYLRITFFHDA
jgi:hypothetical protein